MSTPIEKVPEPVRKYIYSVAGVLLLALLAWGVLDDNNALIIAGILQAVMVVPAETARAKVKPWPPATPPD